MVRTIETNECAKMDKMSMTYKRDLCVTPIPARMDRFSVTIRVRSRRVLFTGGANSLFVEELEKIRLRVDGYV